jgi:hypothetical protein
MMCMLLFCAGVPRKQAIPARPANSPGGLRGAAAQHRDVLNQRPVMRLGKQWARRVFDTASVRARMIAQSEAVRSPKGNIYVVSGALHPALLRNGSIGRIFSDGEVPARFSVRM